MEPEARRDDDSKTGQLNGSGPRNVFLQKSRGKDAQNNYFRPQFHMKVPHDFDSKTKEHRLNRTAEPLDDYPFGELIVS